MIFISEIDNGWTENENKPMSGQKQKLLKYELRKAGFADAEYITETAVMKVEPGNARMPEIYDNGDIHYGSEYEGTAQMLRTAVDSVNEITAAWQNSQAMPFEEVSQFHVLSEYNGVVFAARDDTERGYGFEYATWKYNYHRTGVELGYYTGNYCEAKENFAIRSGLVEKSKILPPERESETADIEVSPEVMQQLKRQLYDRIEANYAEYNRGLLEYSKELLIGMARSISAVQDIYDYIIKDNYTFEKSDIEFLLQFQHPLDIISDQWYDRISDISDIDTAIGIILDNKDCITKSYLKINEKHIIPQGKAEKYDKPSLLGQLHENLKEVKAPSSTKKKNHEIGGD